MCCNLVPLCSGHQFQSPASKVCSGLTQQSWQTDLFSILVKLLTNSYPLGIKLLIFKVCLFNAHLAQDKPDPKPINKSAWYK